MIRKINPENWSRRRQFEFFRHYEYPHFNISTNIEITGAYHYTKKSNRSLFKTILYVSLKIINDIPEFRLRIRNDQVIEHSVVHPSFTVSIADNQFSFCNADFNEDIDQFFQNVAAAMRKVKENPFIRSDSSEDNRIYITCLPWISFTGLMHPIKLNSADSVPRLAWGKYIISQKSVLLPYSIQAHHALVDGYHAGLFINKFQELINQPDAFFRV